MNTPRSTPSESFLRQSSRRSFISGSLAASIALMLSGPDAFVLAAEEDKNKRFEQSVERAKMMRKDANWLLKTYPELLGQADANVIECIDEGMDGVRFYLDQAMKMKIPAFKGSLDVISVPGAEKLIQN